VARKRKQRVRVINDKVIKYETMDGKKTKKLLALD
jgi:hypothetical protein